MLGEAARGLEDRHEQVHVGGAIHLPGLAQVPGLEPGTEHACDHRDALLSRRRI